MVRWVLRISDGQKDLRCKMMILNRTKPSGYLAGNGYIYALYERQYDMNEGWAMLRRSGYTSTRMGDWNIPEGEKQWQVKE